MGGKGSDMLYADEKNGCADAYAAEKNGFEIVEGVGGAGRKMWVRREIGGSRVEGSSGSLSRCRTYLAPTPSYTAS
eukprot:2398934-Rhodomonas_salina.1